MTDAIEPVRIGPMTFEAYLAFEEQSEIRHEYVDGYAYAMAGGTDTHNTITLNIATKLHPRGKLSGCSVHMADVKVKVAFNGIRYPDVFVTCSAEDRERRQIKEEPCLIFEVLSKGTADDDITTKKTEYTGIPALEQYVIVSQDQPRVIVYTRRAEGFEERTYLDLADEVSVGCLDATLSLSEIYDGVFGA